MGSITHPLAGARLRHRRNQDVGGNVCLGMQAWAYVPGTFEIPLPPGKIRVEICKGPEYRPVSESFHLQPGKLALRMAIEPGSTCRRWAGTRVTAGHIFFPHTQASWKHRRKTFTSPTFWRRRPRLLSGRKKTRPRQHPRIQRAGAGPCLSRLHGGRQYPQHASSARQPRPVKLPPRGLSPVIWWSRRNGRLDPCRLVRSMSSQKGACCLDTHLSRKRRWFPGRSPG